MGSFRRRVLYVLRKHPRRYPPAINQGEKKVALNMNNVTLIDQLSAESL